MNMQSKQISLLTLQTSAEFLTQPRSSGVAGEGDLDFSNNHGPWYKIESHIRCKFIYLF